MTQAFNLSQLANRVNTSGQLNAATGLTGTVPIGNGGTGVTAVGAAGNVLTSNGTAWVSQAASAGFSGATVNSPSASTLTLTNASAQCQIIQFTSPANSIVTLPSATTLLYRGAPIYRLINESQCNAPIQVRNAAGTWIATIPVNQAVDITLEDNSTSAGTWMVDSVDQLPTPAAVENASISAIAQTTTYSVYASNGVYVRQPVCCALTDSLYVFAWYYAEPSGYARQAIVAASLTGNTFAFGAVSYQAPIGNITTSLDGVSRVFRLNNTTAVVEFRMQTTYDACGLYGMAYNRAAVVTVSGNTVTVGGYNANNMPEQGNAGLTSSNFLDVYMNQGFRFRISDTHFASVYHTGASSGQASMWPNGCGGNLATTITSVSGTTQTNGTAATLAANNGNIMGVTSHTDGAFIMTYYTSSSAGAATGIRKAVTCNTSGTTATWGTVTNIDISNITTNASKYQYGNGVTLSSTKVCLPVYQITGSGPLYDIGTFTISGATNAFVANSNCNMLSSTFMLLPRSASTFLATSQDFDGRQNSTNSGNITLTGYAVNANNAVYPDTNYTFQNNSQLGGSFATNFLAPPSTSGSTVAVQLGALYTASPAQTTIYLSKGTLPT